MIHQPSCFLFSFVPAFSIYSLNIRLKLDTIVNARKEADKNAVAVKNRIKLLEKEDNNIVKKIEKTRRMADKI